MAAGFDREIKRIGDEIAKLNRRLTRADKVRKRKIEEATRAFESEACVVQPVIERLETIMAQMQGKGDPTQQPA